MRSMHALLSRRRRGSNVAGLLAAALLLAALASCSKNNPTKVVPGPDPVASVVLNPTTATITAGGSATLSATPEDALGAALTGRTVTWSSDHTAVATVNASGRVTGVAAGSATITATCEGKSGSSDVTITNVPVASVTVAPASASVQAGSTTQLTATPKDGGGTPLTGRVVTWSSDNTAYATVNGSGRVTGVAAGSATITATCEGKTGTSSITVTPASTGGAAFNHVFIVVEENTNYADVIGNTAMPYLNGLAQQYGLATSYYANTHPSIGNYFMMTIGAIVTNDDSYTGTVTQDNVIRHLIAAGKTWKAYAEDIPSAGFLSLDYDDSKYASRHNPVVYLSDVRNDATQAAHVVPFTQFVTDLAANAFPNYSFIVPNLCDDGHDCGGDVVDQWLQVHIDPLIKSAQFQQDGLLIILYDESGSDDTHGGGQIAWVAVSAKSKPGYQSSTLYQHESTLRLTLKALGLTSFPYAAATAPDMSEFFNP
jgi:phosphatidylinositol-3-phosphatase